MLIIKPNTEPTTADLFPDLHLTTVGGTSAVFCRPYSAMYDRGLTEEAEGKCRLASGYENVRKIAQSSRCDEPRAQPDPVVNVCDSDERVLSCMSGPTSATWWNKGCYLP
ncbi:hypothetical protein Bbelb_324080 [Branchiostoma belcheri]|nr:hypothetical protein Bbelb_324080 [Branchiostoma belcheri]